LKDDNFPDVMACLKSLSGYLRESNLLDKQIGSAITTIIHLGRAWAVEEEGMLRSNLRSLGLGKISEMIAEIAKSGVPRKGRFKFSKPYRSSNAH
jgi:hypothetical protein